MSELIGSELGLYQIKEVLGVGGMSTVFRAYHAALDRHVALKVLPEHMSLDGELRQRFRQEVRLIARLEHAHILPIYDYGQDRGRLYLVMRYIEAGTLEDRIAQGPMDLGEISRVMHQIAPALDHAHRHGVVHRDIKPSNVLIDAQGDCYLSDFGLAKTLETSIRLTSSGIAMGTPAYMSPEQVKGETVDARSDVYSLGAMLFEMTTGRVPFEAKSPTAVALKHVTDPVPLPTGINPALPPPVEQVILCAMAKDPNDRYPNVGEMLEAFNGAVLLASQPVTLRSGWPGGRSKRKAAVWGRIVARAALVAAIVLSVLLLPGAFSDGRFNRRPGGTESGDPGTAALSEVGSAQVLASFATSPVTVQPSPTFTRRPTAVPTATLPPAPTSTVEATDTPAPTFSPTAGATLSLTSAATATATAAAATAAATDTPTPTSTATAAPTRSPTHTPWPTPTPRWLPAPTLLGPADGASFVGWNARVILSWAEVAGMLPDEYYVVRIPYDDRGGVAEFWRQETSLEVPPTFSSRQVGFPDRRYAWTVQAVRCTRNCARALDDNARKEGVAVGAESAARVFYWQPDIGGSPADTPIPTRKLP